MQAIGSFDYYIQGTPATLLSLFSKSDNINAAVSMATFNVLTGAQMITSLKSAITTKLEGLPGGPHTVEFV